MQSKRLLGVDCDLTVCPSDIGWFDWLYEVCSWEDARANQLKYINNASLPYDLGSMFPSVEDPYDYWRKLDYSQFKPLAGAVEKLRVLSEYFDIVFISQIKGVHSKSKYYWLKEHFPFMEEYIAMKKKGVIGDSLVAHIDDRLNVLEGFQPHKRVLFKTHYTQTSDCSVAYEITNWEDFSVKDFCQRFL